MTRLLLVLLISIFGTACRKPAPSGTTDPFYTNRGGWDYARLPLIKPYEVWYLNDVYSLQARGENVTVANLMLLGVQKNVIFGRAGSQDIQIGEKIVKSENAGDWFCLNTQDRNLTWFQTKEAMYESVKKQTGAEAEEPSTLPALFREFQFKSTCKWFPKQG